jgi:uncharacterized protein (TIGR00290 family)
MRTLLSWSGGKDAAFAHHSLVTNQTAQPISEDHVDPADCEVVELLTTTSADTDRISIHGVRPELVEAQADALGLPLTLVELPADPSNEQYEDVMAEATRSAADRGIDCVAFADLFLEDVRDYRETQLARGPIPGVWPVWGLSTESVAERVADAFEAYLVAVDGRHLDASFAGRRFDRELLADLPDSVDRCGENGEFHTFVADGPEFDHAVTLERGETVTRESGGVEFHYCDLLLAEE